MMNVFWATQALRGRDEPSFEYTAAYVRRAATFYARVFGARGGREMGGVSAADLRVARVVTPVGAIALPCIAVEDVDDALARVWSNGGEVLEMPRSDEDAGGWVATFRDPAGNVIALCRRGPMPRRG